jgi:FkbM family methyltransferase
MIPSTYYSNDYREDTNTIDKLYESDLFYVDNKTKKNLGIIRNIESSIDDVVKIYGWDFYIFHEIYNMKTYSFGNYINIDEGDIVVDLGANIGIFNRWAYKQGASLIVSIEPDISCYNLLKLNANPKSIVYNAAISNVVGSIILYEGIKLGSSSIVDRKYTKNGYKVNSITLDYLFNLNIFSKIDFLKIDIEGAEILAFEGISDSNLNKIKKIVLEYHNIFNNYNISIRQNLINRLVNLGFNSHILFYEFDDSIQMIYFYK